MWPRPAFGPSVTSRDSTGSKPFRHIPPGMRGTLLSVSGNLLVQELKRNPSRGIIVIIGGVPDRAQVFSDRSKAKICDPCMAGGVHKDV
jgi:hypothetical protein